MAARDVSNVALVAESFKESEQKRRLIFTFLSIDPNEIIAIRCALDR